MNLQIFENSMFGTVRCLNKDGEPWFVGKDVASALGYKDTSRAVYDHVDDEDKTSLVIQQSGSNYKATTIFINESGLYSLVFSSKLDSALKFKHWVTSEVLPQIRKTGGYIPVSEDDDEKEILAKALVILKKTIERKDELIEAQRPAVQFAEAVTSCEDSILIRDLAKLITQNGVKIGQARLFYWLRLNSYLFQKETRPIQKWLQRKHLDATTYGSEALERFRRRDGLNGFRAAMVAMAIYSVCGKKITDTEKKVIMEFSEWVADYALMMHDYKFGKEFNNILDQSQSTDVQKKVPILDKLPGTFTLAEAYRVFNGQKEATVRKVLGRLVSDKLLVIVERGVYSKK